MQTYFKTGADGLCVRYNLHYDHVPEYGEYLYCLVGGQDDVEIRYDPGRHLKAGEKWPVVYHDFDGGAWLKRSEPGSPGAN